MKRLYDLLFGDPKAACARTRRTLASGEIVCPHCGVRNMLDVLATCGTCKVTEYGNRLRCSCGEVSKGFECDSCGVTIRVL
jgi:hypothetical protein